MTRLVVLEPAIGPDHNGAYSRRDEDVSSTRSWRFLREHRAGDPRWQCEDPHLWPAYLPSSGSRTRKGYVPEEPGLLLRRNSRRRRGVPPVRSLHARLLSGYRG